MTDINLLPWREKKREQEKKQFAVYLILGLIVAAVVVLLVNYYATSLVEEQTARNQQLKNEIIQLEQQIKEIAALKKVRQSLIARMTIVQNLQATRALTVRLFDELIRIMPDGVYLSHMDRVGNKVTILGYAESNTNISLVMRNIQLSEWIQDPVLTEIKRTAEAKRPDDNQFKLSFILKSKSMLGPKL
jgi:type IV pilus assembly protein PilN